MGETQRSLEWYEVQAGYDQVTFHVGANGTEEVELATKQYLMDANGMGVGINPSGPKIINQLSAELHDLYDRLQPGLRTCGELGAIVLLKGFRQDLSFSRGDMFNWDW